MIFFYFQNKEDLKVVWEYKDIIDYKVIHEKCPEKSYECFIADFESMAKEVSITGLSLGLKLAFNYLEESKQKSKKKYKDIEFALKHLEVNNIVIKYTNNRFHGFKNLYGGYIGKMIDFFKSSKNFSDNLIIGLKKSEDGLKSVDDQEKKAQFSNWLEKVINNYNNYKEKIQSFLDKEVSRLEKEYQG